MIEFRELSDSQGWDELLAHFPDALVYHTRDWLSFLAAHFHTKPHFFELHRDGKRVGLYPEFRPRTGPIRFLASPMPIWSTPRLGPVLADKYIPDFLRSLLKHARQVGTDQIEIFLSRKMPPDEEIHEIFRPIVQKTLVLDLRPGAEEIFRHSLDAQCRNKVRKAQKKGLVIREVKLVDISDEYLELARTVYAKWGQAPPFTADFYRTMHTHLESSGKLRVLGGYLNGRLHAAVVLLAHNKRLFYHDSVGSDEARKISANNLMQWTAIEWACERGLTEYDMVGANIPSIATFKASFGAKPFEYSWIDLSLTRRARLARRAYALLSPALKRAKKTLLRQ